jgi:hypothetical protein
MASWPTIDAAITGIVQRVFGEPVVYQSTQAQMALGSSVTITAIRHARVKGESGPLANAEEISINPADLPVAPQRGDWVTAWGTQWVVGGSDQPDPNGMVALTLTPRSGQKADG